MCGIVGIRLRNPDLQPILGELVVTMYVPRSRPPTADRSNSQSRGDLAGLVLGSTAHKVIHLAGRPALVVR